MNLLECTVTEITSKPYFKYDKWWLNVEYSCWGLNSKTSLMFDTELECNMPEDFIQVWEGEIKTNFASSRSNATHNAIEKLFTL